MNRPPKPCQPSNLARSTQIAARQMSDLLARARDIELDTQKEARTGAQLCRSCFYGRSSVLAGQAFTSQPCGCCLTEQVYSSTNTDVLCLPCATLHRLCKHCSSDIEMNTSRTDWPSIPGA